MRMLVATWSAERVIDVAQTGAPAWASTVLTPTARKSVVLPAMLEPVTSRTVPASPRSTSLTTRRAPGSSGWPSPCATSLDAPSETAGQA
ncbi:MAG: hypothetical protein QM765_01895 [Myxococcales bacterium]